VTHPRPHRLLLGFVMASIGALAAAPARAADDVLTGAWTLAASDLTPSSSYTIHGDELDLAWAGYYSWNGTWASGFEGYSFTRPAQLVEGATYQLTLTVTNASNPIPAVLRASLSGAGAEQSQTFFGGNGSVQLTFTVASCPGAAPALTLTAHPALGHLGPLDGVGVLFQSYDVTASLVRID
jgi:hypothetical protein